MVDAYSSDGTDGQADQLRVADLVRTEVQRTDRVQGTVVCPQEEVGLHRSQEDIRPSAAVSEGLKNHRNRESAGEDLLQRRDRHWPSNSGAGSDSVPTIRRGVQEAEEREDLR